jgi:hypothetical protein
MISHIFAKSSILASESRSNFYENAATRKKNFMLHVGPNSDENDGSLSRLFNINVVNQP